MTYPYFQIHKVPKTKVLLFFCKIFDSLMLKLNLAAKSNTNGSEAIYNLSLSS